MYADYVMNFDQAMELLRAWNERSSAFRNIVQDIQVQISLSIYSYMCLKVKLGEWSLLSLCVSVLTFFLFLESGSVWLSETAAPHVRTGPKGSTL